MNNERTVVLENVAKQPVGLKDTQNRTYRLGIGARVRISEISLQDILDYPASKIIFNEGMVKIHNVSAAALYNMGLTDKEIKIVLGTPAEDKAVVITKTIEEEDEEEEIIPVEEPKEVTIEKPVVAPAPKTTTTSKPAAKKLHHLRKENNEDY